MEKCIYCGDDATTQDHFIPLSYYHSGNRKKYKLRNQYKNNLVPCCNECNILASNKCFDTLEDKRDYIQNKLRKRYKKILRFPEWSEEELEEMDVTFRQDVRLRSLSKKWLINRTNFPTIIYEDEIGMREILKIINNKV